MKTKIFTLMAIITMATTANAADALSGKFTINSRGDQVFFSKGNLQASTSDYGESWTWDFALNQWDYIGKAASNDAILEDGTVSVNAPVDLFCWSTPSTYYGINSTTSDLPGRFIDWGATIGEGWYTLSKDEWVYLFHGRSKADELFGLGSVNGINGTIILPDNWTLPEGAIFNKAKDNNLVWSNGGYDDYYYYFNEHGYNFSHNTYTIGQWETMERAGAVFLPAAGYRTYTIVYHSGEIGHYWSSTRDGECCAYYLYFDQVTLEPQNYEAPRDFGYSVRLVLDSSAPAGIEEINAAAIQEDSRKIFHDGQLFIRCGEEIFNAQGARVK